MMRLAFLLIGLAALVSADRGPRTLHERTCIGLWMPAVHLHGICLIDVSGRSNQTEVDRLFETENEPFDPLPLDKVPHLVMQRALEEHALARIPRQLVANVDRTFVEPQTGCSAGFYGYKGKCYIATRNRVSYPEAERLCGNIHGKLVDDFSDDIVGLLQYLVSHYIKVDVFTAYDKIDDLGNHPDYNVRNTHVELDYETARLQYVVQGEQRGFICEVPANVKTQPLLNPVDLPATIDDVISHDLNPPSPVKPSVERYLVDLLRFNCPGNYTQDAQKQQDVVVSRADLVDLDKHNPYGCHYNKSLGNVVYDLNNPLNLPRELDGVCKNLVRLYRTFDKLSKTEYYSIHPQPKVGYGRAEPRIEHEQVGYCAAKQGDCGASIPLIQTNSRRPVCYLFESHRDLDLELKEDRPLRLVQVANRLVQIYNSKNEDSNDVGVQLDPNAEYHSTQPQLLGSLLSPDSYKQLNHYCKERLVPVYKIRDLHHRNVFLTTELDQVKQYRQSRDHYIEEELLGYGANAQSQGYCGAYQALHHYRFVNRVKKVSSHHQDDGYFNVEQPVGSGVQHEILVYLF